MARARMVTRAIIGTEVKALCFNTQENKGVEKDIVVAGTFKDADKLAKKLHEILDNETEAFVKVIATAPKSTLYGMTEDEFIKNSVVLDPEKRKPIEVEA